MDQTLSLGWTESEARSRRSSYRRILGLNLALQAVLALFALVAPGTLSHILDLPDPDPSGWLRAWGGLLLLVTALYVPGLLEPVQWRWGNVVGIAGRLPMAFLYLLLGDGFLWLALFEAAFGLLLAILYFRLFTAELMSRP